VKGWYGSLFRPGTTTTTDIKRQNIEHSPILEPARLLPDRKSQQSQIDRAELQVPADHHFTKPTHFDMI
jgi:hypothetical protein